MYRFSWLFFGALIIYSGGASLTIPKSKGGSRGVWWNNECVFANWKNVKPVDYTTNEAVYTYYTGRTALLLRDGHAEEYEKDYASDRTFLIAVDYYLLHYSVSPIADEFLQVFGRALENGAVIVVKSAVRSQRRSVVVVSVSEYP